MLLQNFEYEKYQQLFRIKVYLLHLELDRRLNFVDLGNHRLLVGEKTREFTSFV